MIDQLLIKAASELSSSSSWSVASLGIPAAAAFAAMSALVPRRNRMCERWLEAHDGHLNDNLSGIALYYHPLAAAGYVSDCLFQKARAP